MRKFVNGRLALTVFIVTILVLFQFFIPAVLTTSYTGCSLSDQTSRKTNFSSYYGFPSEVLVTHTEVDCSGNQNTSISDFSMEGLLVDILFVVVVGALPYLVFSLFDRFRRRNNAE